MSPDARPSCTPADEHSLPWRHAPAGHVRLCPVTDATTPTRHTGDATGGFQRNALAIAGGLLLIALIVLLPDLGPASGGAAAIQLGHGRIVELRPPPEEGAPPTAVVEMIGGPRDGRLLEGNIQGAPGQAAVPDFEVGDEVVVSLTFGSEGEGIIVTVTDQWRIPALAGIGLLFALAVAMVGGWRGIRSLIALALTLVVVVKILLPLILAGWEPVLLAVACAALITLATLLLTEGWRWTTLAAVLGTLAALALTAALAVLATSLAEFSPAQGSEEAFYIESILGTRIELRGLVLAAVILGALGVLDDVTVTQAATVHELHRADPAAGGRALFGRALNIGRSHIAATVNTLVLAYIGVSLPLLVLLAAGRQDLLAITSGEAVAVEVVRALVGSIGIVAAVPLTTVIAVWLVRRGSRRSGPAARSLG